MNRSAALRLGGSAAAAAAGCAFFPARAGAQSTSVPLRIVGARNESGAVLYYAQDLGMFADAGLDVHPEALNATATMVAAVLAGDVTIAGITIPYVDGTYVKDGAIADVSDGDTGAGLSLLSSFPYLGTPYSGYNTPA